MNVLVRSSHAGFADDDSSGYTYTQTSIARLAACLVENDLALVACALAQVGGR